MGPWCQDFRRGGANRAKCGSVFPFVRTVLYTFALDDLTSSYIRLISRACAVACVSLTLHLRIFFSCLQLISRHIARYKTALPHWQEFGVTCRPLRKNRNVRNERRQQGPSASSARRGGGRAGYFFAVSSRPHRYRYRRIPS